MFGSERVSIPAGIVGTLAFSWGVLDVIGRLQTAAGLLPYLNLPLAIGLIIVGPFLVWYAIASEAKKNLQAYQAEIAKKRVEPDYLDSASHMAVGRKAS
jgi:hypothetical protein